MSALKNGFASLVVDGKDVPAQIAVVQKGALFVGGGCGAPRI
jgi:hypothetical protein